MTGGIPVSDCGQSGAAQILIEKLYRDALHGTRSRATLLGDDARTQFHRFVDDIFQLLCWYPSPALSPSLTDPRNEHLAFRTTVLSTIGALVADTTSGTEPNGVDLWLRVLSPLSTREEELIETTSELRPASLSRSLNSALDQYDRAKLRCSPFRSTLFRPGLKHTNTDEFRHSRAARQMITCFMRQVMSKPAIDNFSSYSSSGCATPGPVSVTLTAIRGPSADARIDRHRERRAGETAMLPMIDVSFNGFFLASELR